MVWAGWDEGRLRRPEPATSMLSDGTSWGLTDPCRVISTFNPTTSLVPSLGMLHMLVPLHPDLSLEAVRQATEAILIDGHCLLLPGTGQFALRTWPMR
jgi:hypothetical protein